MSAEEDLEQRTRRLYRDYSSRIRDLLGAEDVPEIQVEFSDRGIAETSGTRIILNRDYFSERQDDGAIIHELAHVIHRAPRYDDETRWLIEGLADYVRNELGFNSKTAFPHYEPGKALSGYMTSAHFLLWLEEVRPRGVLLLSKHIMGDTYNAEIFKHVYEKVLEQLVSEYEERQS